MAIPLPAEFASIVAPVARPLRVVGEITAPLAVSSDSYLGGYASGNRFRYDDAMEFVWWTPGVTFTTTAFSAAFSPAFR